MPLNRDAIDQNVLVKSVADFTAHRQQAREPATSPRRMSARPGALHESRDHRATLNRSEEGEKLGDQPLEVSRSDQNDGKAWRLGTMDSLKLPVVDTVQIHRERMLRRPSLEQNHLPQMRSDHKQTKPRSKRPATNTGKVSAFDDTESISQSMLDDSFDDNITTIFRPPAAQPWQDYTRNTQDHVPQSDSPPRGTQEALLEEIMASDWQKQVEDERQFQQQQRQQQQQQRGSVTQLRDSVHAFQPTIPQTRPNIFRHTGSSPDAPETPSRIRSVPPTVGNIHAPVARRAVGFVSSPEIFGDSTGSPAFNSAQLASEDSPRPIRQRPSSAQPRGIAFHDKERRPTPTTQSGLRNGVAPKPTSRFQKLEDHKQSLLPENIETPATEHPVSDSLDEAQGNEPLLINVTKQSELTKTSNRKRSFDQSQALDYDPAILFQKSLSDLQSEPFTADPRQPPAPTATNSHGVEMTHEQILQNLHRITPERQREIFKAENDEEWEQTGKWFVDMFQQDLKLLTEVRLNRRRVALQFEDKIRRRQRLVEHQVAVVNKELEALQDGGAGLLKDRKPVGSSRAGTPIRPARP